MKDLVFPEIKPKNPNLKKLMMLNEVNSEILQFGYFVRDIDNVLLVTLA